MKCTVLSAGPANPHAGWVAVDELASLLQHHFGATWRSPRSVPDHALRRLTGRARPCFERLPPDEGGDVLFVVARDPGDLAMVSAVPDARRRYARIHAFVTDSYFKPGYPAQTALYDSITVTAHEDADHPRQRFGIRVDHLHQGIDGLRWAPRGTPARREIDLIAYGRTPPSFHRALTEAFHDPASPFLYLHSPLGNLRGPTVERERGMLFKLLHRSHVSLAFHLYVEPEHQRPRSMMVTSRWLESLVAGCLVAGQRPVSRMADDMLPWEGATIELPPESAATVEALKALLPEREGWQAQRARNVAEVLRRHDWRWRLRRLAELNAWAEPPSLTEELEQVLALARAQQA